MMGKLLACLGLIALSFVILHFTIGIENFASTSAAPEGESSTSENVQGGGLVEVENTDGGTTHATITTTGKKNLPMHIKRVKLGNGSELLIPLYTLIAEDSQPVRDDLWRLDAVRVVFQEEGQDENGQPIAVSVGELIASQAFVQIGRDQSGMPSVVKEDRDIDLRDVVFSTEPTARIKNLRLQVGRILVRSSEAGTKLHTPTPDQPFELLLKGDSDMTMTGRGLDFVMPAENRDQGARYMEINIDSQPRIDREDISLHAEGKLTYREDMGRGVAQVTLDDQVKIRGLGEAQGSPLVANGDHLDAVLVRRSRGSGSGAVWQDLHLTGEEVTLDFGDMLLRCRQLDVIPSINGKPYLLTASGLGSPVMLKQSGEQTLSFSAENRVHLCRLDQYFDPINKGFGFPAGLQGSWMQQLIIFEGRSQVTDPTNNLDLTATDGIRLLRPSDAAGPSIAVGLGTVDVRQGDLVMKGTSGFTLWQDLETRRLRLGPAEPDREHAFSLASGDGLSFEGHGLCEVRQGKNGETILALISPDEDLEIVREGANLSGIGQLDLEIIDGKPSQMLATGKDCHLLRDTEDPRDRIDGNAMRIESRDGRNFELTGSPARLLREYDGSDLRAPHITFAQLDEKQVMVIARGDESGPATATMVRAANEDQLKAAAIELEAGLIRLLPKLADIELAELASQGIETPRQVRDQQHLIASGRVRVKQLGEDGSLLADAHGDVFVMQLTEQSGTLLGIPAKIVREQGDGRRMIAKARRVIFTTEENNATVLVLMPTEDQLPIVEITGFKGDDFGDFENLRITCDGKIKARQEQVDFLGPVLVVQLDANGVVKPGMQLSAARLEMRTDGKQLTEIIASGDAALDFDLVSVKGDRLMIDVLDSSCLAIGENDDVEITYPGSLARGPMIKINYRTRDMESWYINLDTDGKIQGR